jgi:hypothetical protein
LISDTKGNIFGGFTPVKWESPWSGKYKGDDSARSFLFTLKNPRGVPARTFVLKAQEKASAIGCDSTWGPHFGEGCISVSDNCNTSTDSHTFNFGDQYDSVSGGQEKDFLTGAVSFRVKEIEVFEIAH